MSLSTLYNFSMERWEAQPAPILSADEIVAKRLEYERLWDLTEPVLMPEDMDDFDRVHVGRYSMDGMSYGCNIKTCAGTCDGACRFALDEDEALYGPEQF